MPNRRNHKPALKVATQGLTKSSPQAQSQRHKKTTTTLTTGSLFLNISFVDICYHWFAATSSFIACLKHPANRISATPVMTSDEVQNYLQGGHGHPKQKGNGRTSCQFLHHAPHSFSALDGWVKLRECGQVAQADWWVLHQLSASSHTMFGISGKSRTSTFKIPHLVWILIKTYSKVYWYDNCTMEARVTLFLATESWNLSKAVSDPHIFLHQVQLIGWRHCIFPCHSLTHFTLQVCCKILGFFSAWKWIGSEIIIEQSNLELFGTGTLVHLVTCFNLLRSVVWFVKRNLGKPNLSFLRLAIVAQNNTWWIIWRPHRTEKLRQVRNFTYIHVFVPRTLGRAWNCSYKIATLPAAYHVCLINHSLCASIYQDQSRLFFRDGHGKSWECMPTRLRKILYWSLSDTDGRYSFNSH